MGKVGTISDGGSKCSEGSAPGLTASQHSRVGNERAYDVRYTPACSAVAIACIHFISFINSAHRRLKFVCVCYYWHFHITRMVEVLSGYMGRMGFLTNANGETDYAVIRGHPLGYVLS